MHFAPGHYRFEAEVAAHRPELQRRPARLLLTRNDGKDIGVSAAERYAWLFRTVVALPAAAALLVAFLVAPDRIASPGSSGDARGHG